MAGKSAFSAAALKHFDTPLKTGQDFGKHPVFLLSAKLQNYAATVTKNRSEFKRFLTDCNAGKVDIILAKSISRFALLKSIG